MVALGESELLTSGVTASVRKTLHFAAGTGEIGGQKEAARRRLLESHTQGREGGWLGGE